ncbi:MAG: M14 family metallopeptidase [Thermomicrobiales bacterium]
MSNTGNRSFVFPLPVDPAPEPFTTGRAGWLVDRDDDGFADDVSIRLTVEPGMSYPLSYWGDLLDIAARIGCQNVAIPEALTSVPGGSLPDGIEVKALTIEGAHRVATGARYAETTLPETPPTLEDLRDFWTVSGALVDANGDGRGDGSRLRIVLPDPCPAELGLAAVELAARLGLETTGLRLPLLIMSPDDLDQAELLLDLSGESETSGSGSISLDGGIITVSGTLADRVRAALFLANVWPRLDTTESIAAYSDRIGRAVRSLVFAETPEAKVSVLVAALDGIESGTTIQLTTEDPAELAAATAALAPRGITVEPGAMPGGFTLDWTSEWEVDEARSVVLHDAAAAIDANGNRAELLVLVSEPPDVRSDLERSLSLRFPEATVRVRSAYKGGLSWLLEDVAPAVESFDRFDRIEISFPSFSADDHLDLRTRWLQELYPGDELLARQLSLPESAITFHEETETAVASYSCTVFAGEDEVWSSTFTPASIALPYLTSDPGWGHVLASTGVVRVTVENETIFEQPLEPDPLRFWLWFQQQALPQIGDAMASTWSEGVSERDQPFFDAVDIELWISEQDARLEIREELDSPAEALHEDCYFGTLDWLDAFAAARGVANIQGPGAIRPVIHLTPGSAPKARVTYTPRRTHAATIGNELIAPLAAAKLPDIAVNSIVIGENGLETIHATSSSPVETPRSDVASSEDTISIAFSERSGTSIAHLIIPRAITSPFAGVIPAADANGLRSIVFNDDLPPLLARFRDHPGASVWLAGESYERRPIWAFALTSHGINGRWSPSKLSARKPMVQIAARHHANEVSSTVAAFALAESLMADPHLLRSISIVAVPIENPDGTAFHEALTTGHRYWKHHPARYNAVGLEYGFHEFDEQTRFGEARVRREVWSKWRPHMVIDNHGVPSHEWSQHFSGFGSPPRFGVSYWIPQALLYGIIDYIEGETAERFGTLVSATIARNLAGESALTTLNDALGERYRTWGNSYLPERFPATYDDGFLCYYRAIAPNPQSRNFGVRYPETTLLDWVTEVPDETAHDERLELTARSQELANRSAIDALITFLSITPP